MLEPWQQLAMGSRGLVCTGAAGGGTALSLEGGAPPQRLQRPEARRGCAQYQGPKAGCFKAQGPGRPRRIVMGLSPASQCASPGLQL